jgi:hypothetical protein
MNLYTVFEMDEVDLLRHVPVFNEGGGAIIGISDVRFCVAFAMHVIRECNVTSTAYDCYHSFW